MKSFLLYLYAESPIHAGAADADGAVDLPIQREQATGYPVIWGQSLKGALRRTTAKRKGSDGKKLAEDMFGPAPGEVDGVNAQAGKVTVGDAQLVALPIATLQRSFAWVTSPIALSRISRKYVHAGGRPLSVPSVAADQAKCIDREWAHSQQVIGPFLVPTDTDDGLSEWAEELARDGIGDEPHMEPFAKRFRKNLILAGDDIMRQLVREGTEIAVRVQLNDQGTVEHGPFSSEYLPTESLLVSVITVREAERRDELIELFHNEVLQVGGDQTLGKGLVWSRLVEVGR